MNAVCTIVTKSYLASAILLGRSLQNNNAELKYYIFLADKNNLNINIEFNIIEASEIGIKDYYELAYQYEVVEFCTSIKPSCIKYLFKQYNFEKIMYIDPDIYIYGKLDKLIEYLNKYDVLLTPHILSSSIKFDNQEIECGLLGNGIFNLGFIGFNNSINSINILDWWENRLKKHAYSDRSNYLYTDQKWMNLLPTVFSNILILKDMSYNISWWNLKERIIDEKNGKYYVFDKNNNMDKEICFFHFSGFNPDNEYAYRKILCEKDISKMNILDKIYLGYKEELLACGYYYYKKMSYDYMYYDNGIIITKLQRRLYRKQLEKGIKYENLFDTKKGSYYHILSKNKLIVMNKDKIAVNIGRKDINNFSRKEKIVKMGLVILKKILGIKNYYFLTRYLSNSLLEEEQDFLIKNNK